MKDGKLPYSKMTIFRHLFGKNLIKKPISLNTFYFLINLLKESFSFFCFVHNLHKKI